MNIQIEKLAHSEVKITVEVSAQKMTAYRKKTVEELQSSVKVDGFRAGNIPAEVLIQKIGEQAFMGQMMDLAISDSYESAVQENDIRPVAYPKINIVTQEPLKYEATVAVVPEMTWKKSLDKLKVKKKGVKVEKKEIEEVLENLKTRSTKWSDVERAAKMGDRTEIDFDGFDLEGKALDGTSSKNHPLILGSKSLIPGFEEEVVGMKIDEEKTFEITFPKDYHSDDFKGKKVKFTVKVNRIEEPAEPTLDDDFAKEITAGNRQTMKELEEEIVEELTKQKERQEESEREKEFLKLLMENVKADLPEALIDREKDLMLGRMKEDLEKKKKTWEDYLSEIKKDEAGIRKEMDKPAKEQVYLRLAVERLNEDEPVEVKKDEVEAELELMYASYPPQYAVMLKERYKEGTQEWEMIRAQAKLRKHVEKHTEK